MNLLLDLNPAYQSVVYAQALAERVHVTHEKGAGGAAGKRGGLQKTGLLVG